MSLGRSLRAALILSLLTAFPLPRPKTVELVEALSWAPVSSVRSSITPTVRLLTLLCSLCSSSLSLPSLGALLNSFLESAPYLTETFNSVNKVNALPPLSPSLCFLEFLFSKTGMLMHLLLRQQPRSNSDAVPSSACSVAEGSIP